METQFERRFPQVKVCGLTDPVQARACADLGADAIGLVFYPPSPRHVSLEKAAAICAALPPGVMPTGVFVDPEWELLVETVSGCGLKAVQLHGHESPGLAERIASELGVKTIKALFSAKAPGLDQAGNFKVDAFLVECGLGVLPGGNARTWDWGTARIFAQRYPTLLAGGLDPDNLPQAVSACLPDGVDASSGLERSPGDKDLKKVERFITHLRQTAHLYKTAGKSISPVFQ